MKMRIQGNSIRLRLLRSEVAAFAAGQRIEETIYFSANEQARLSYRLEREDGLVAVAVRHGDGEITVVLPSEQAIAWAHTEQTGVYATVGIGAHGSLEVTVEKDFACLDSTDAENEDTFAHPRPDAVC